MIQNNINTIKDIRLNIMGSNHSSMQRTIKLTEDGNENEYIGKLYATDDYRRLQVGAKTEDKLSAIFKTEQKVFENYSDPEECYKFFDDLSKQQKECLCFTDQLK